MTLEKTQHTEWDELADQHHRLGHILEEMRCTFAQRKASQATMVGLLGELKDVVQAHFIHEEDGGFFDKIIAEAPRYERQAETILGEHPQLLQRLDQMIRCAESNETSDGWWSELEIEFKEFSQQFHKHEQKESSLLQETYSRDMGAED